MGAGSLGPVFRGEDPLNRTSVAVKVIDVGLQPPQLHAVVDALSALVETFPSHPSLAAPLAAGLADGAPYVVWPLLDGDALDIALRDYGPALAADAAERLVTLAEALDAAADAVAWHGALHPRDVIVGDRQSFVIGAGVGPVLERVGIRPPMRRPYAAPEVLAGQVSSPAADQYALAAMAYEWLYGVRITGPAVTRLVLPPLADVQLDALTDAFTSGLAPTPSGRFPDCRAFVEALVLATGGPRPKRVRRRRERRERRESLPALPWLSDPETPAAVTDVMSSHPAVGAQASQPAVAPAVDMHEAQPVSMPAVDSSAPVPLERVVEPSVVMTTAAAIEALTGAVPAETDEWPAAHPAPTSSEDQADQPETHGAPARTECDDRLEMTGEGVDTADDTGGVAAAAIDDARTDSASADMSHPGTEPDVAAGVGIDDRLVGDATKHDDEHGDDARRLDAHGDDVDAGDAAAADAVADVIEQVGAFAADADASAVPLALVSEAIVADVAADMLVGGVTDATARVSDAAIAVEMPAGTETLLETSATAQPVAVPVSASLLADDMTAAAAEAPSWWRRVMGRWFGSRNVAAADGDAALETADASWARGLADAAPELPRTADPTSPAVSASTAGVAPAAETASSRRASWWDRASVVDASPQVDSAEAVAESTAADTANSDSAPEHDLGAMRVDSDHDTDFDAGTDVLTATSVALEPTVEDETSIEVTQEPISASTLPSVPQVDQVPGAIEEPALVSDLRAVSLSDDGVTVDCEAALQTDDAADQAMADLAIVPAADNAYDDARFSREEVAAEPAADDRIDADGEAPSSGTTTPSTDGDDRVAVDAAETRLTPQHDESDASGIDDSVASLGHADRSDSPAPSEDPLGDLSFGSPDADDSVAQDDGVDASPPDGRSFGRLAVAAALVVGIGLGVWGGYAFARRMAWIAVTVSPAAAPKPDIRATTPPQRQESARTPTPSRPAPVADALPSATPAPQTEPAASVPPAAARTPSASERAPAQRPPVAAAPATAAAAATTARRADARTRPAPAAVGRLVVRSQPAGAEVSVDGARRGVTPLVVRDLALGTRRLQIRRSGYAPVEQRITLTARRAARTVTVRLQRSAAAPVTPAPRPQPDAPASAAETRGSLVIESRPAGARVTLDGRPSGVTPVVISGLAAGDHEVQLERSGVAPVTATARVVAGQRTRVAVSLQQ